MQEARQRHIEAALVGRQAGEAGAGHGDAVVAVLAADELLLQRLAARIVVVPDQLDHAVVGFRTGVGEEHLAHRHRRHFDQLLGQLDARPVRLVAEHMVEGQAAQLLLGRGDQALVAEAQRGAPQAGHGLQVLLALFVVDVNTFTARDHQRADLLMQARVGVGVQMVLAVFVGQRAGMAHGHLRRRHSGRLWFW
jgi:hypothetical protein